MTTISGSIPNFSVFSTWAKSFVPERWVQKGHELADSAQPYLSYLSHPIQKLVSLSPSNVKSSQLSSFCTSVLINGITQIGRYICKIKHSIESLQSKKQEVGNSSLSGSLPLLGDQSDDQIETLGDTNIKYEKLGVRILRTVTQSDEIRLVAASPKKNVGMGKSEVILCEQEQPFFLYTDGLGPCVAALAFCQLSQGKRLISCAHITPGRLNKDMELLKNFVDGIVKNPNYCGEKIQFYFAGGQLDVETQYSNTPEYQSYCSYILNDCAHLNCELKGVLFDPYQITREIENMLYWPLGILVKPSDSNLPTDRQVKKEFLESRHVSYLLSCSAGITSSGIPIIRKNLDISFAYDLNKFPSYKNIVEYCLTELKQDILKTYRPSLN